MKATAIRVALQMSGIIFSVLTLFPLPTEAATPCCDITAIDQKGGIVTAKDIATGNIFQFNVNRFGPIDSVKLLNSMRIGQKVFVNFKSGKVSLDGKKTCCTLITGSQGNTLIKPGSSLKFPAGKGSGNVAYIQGSQSDAEEACRQESSKHSNLSCKAVQDADTTDAAGHTIHNWHCECTGAGVGGDKPTFSSPNSGQQ